LSLSLIERIEHQVVVARHDLADAEREHAWSHRAMPSLRSGIFAPARLYVEPADDLLDRRGCRCGRPAFLFAMAVRPIWQSRSS
jgi:hypothetical protein